MPGYALENPVPDVKVEKPDLNMMMQSGLTLSCESCKCAPKKYI